MRERLIVGFWAAIDRRGPDDCWFWTRSLQQAGYGACWDGWRVRTAHAVAWELTNGPLPEGKHATHTCDVRYAPGDISYRACCNPAHTIPGTPLENHRHGVRVGRKTEWPRQWSDAQIAAAERAVTAGTSIAAAARAIGISAVGLQDALKREGLWVRTNSRPRTPEQDAECAALVASGLSERAVGRRLGISRGTVALALKRASLYPR